MLDFMLKYQKYKIIDDKGREYSLHIDRALSFEAKTHQNGEEKVQKAED